MDLIEFYKNNAKLPFASVRSSMVPPVGSYISIKGEAYLVARVTYALDHNSSPYCMRANVYLKSG